MRLHPVHQVSAPSSACFDHCWTDGPASRLQTFTYMPDFDRSLLCQLTGSETALLYMSSHAPLSALPAFFQPNEPTPIHLLLTTRMPIPVAHACTLLCMF